VKRLTSPRIRTFFVIPLITTVLQIYLFSFSCTVQVKQSPTFISQREMKINHHPSSSPGEGIKMRGVFQIINMGMILKIIQ
jgi:hypothetical protein